MPVNTESPGINPDFQTGLSPNENTYKEQEALKTVAANQERPYPDENFSSSKQHEAQKTQTADFHQEHKNTQKNSKEDTSFQDKQIDEKNDSDPLWEQIRTRFYNGPKWFQGFRDKFTNILNTVGISINTFAATVSLLPKVSKNTKKKLDNTGVWYSKYVVPVSFAWNGVEALMGNRPLEALVRVIPAIGFFFLPFHNFNTATGLSSGLNYLLERVDVRLGDKNRAKNMSGNTKEVLKGAADLLKEYFTKLAPWSNKGDKSKEAFVDQLSSLGMTFGSMLGWIFAPNARDSWAARVFGFIRNLGGIAGDAKFITSKDVSAAHKQVGSLCGFASIMNIVMRWVPQHIATPLNHLATAIDDFGLTIWAQGSKRKNDELFKKNLNKNIELHKGCESGK